MAEVAHVLAIVLLAWQRNRRHSTAILSHLAKRKLVWTGIQVLTAIAANTLEVNIFAFSSAAGASQKDRQWESVKGSARRIAYNAAISASAKGGQW